MLGVMPVKTLSFCSGCAVLSMSVASLIRGRNDDVKLDLKASTSLATGAVFGGIIGKDLLKDPGLSRTLLGDGVGSMAGALLGGCPNTTYGESVACVAITRNASVVTILATAILAMLVSFFSPFVAFVNSIPSCVMGGVCIALYGFIAVSGLKMIQQVDLGKDNNLFVVSTILVTGIGGLSLTFGKITITPVAVALILGILANQILKGRSANRD